MKSAYAGQMYSIAKRLQGAGHKVYWMPNSGFWGGGIDYKGIEILPAEAADGDGNDIIGYHVMATKADIVLSLADVFLMPKYGGSDFRWVAYVPIDKTKVDAHTTMNLKRAWRVISPSRYGVDRLEEAGILARHIPHGIERDFIEPINAEEAGHFREVHHITADAFLVGSVGINSY